MTNRVTLDSSSGAESTPFVRDSNSSSSFVTVDVEVVVARVVVPSSTYDTTFNAYIYFKLLLKVSFPRKGCIHCYFFS